MKLFRLVEAFKSFGYPRLVLLLFSLFFSLIVYISFAFHREAFQNGLFRFSIV